LTSDSITPPVTIADIAAAAGVSRATVSKVLNGRADVAPTTRSQVERLLADRGYVRTKRTRKAGAQHGGLIEILFNDASSPWAVEMIRGTEEAARAARVGLVVSVLGEGPKRGRQWIEDMADRNSRGVILALSQLSDADQQRMAKLGVPTILVDPAGDFDSDLPSIAANNWGGGMAATQHLLDLGHRRIGIITGQMRFLFSQARLAGYRAALERANRTVDPRLVAQGDFHFDAAFESALELLSLDDPPTAIFAANDEQALGVYAAAQRRGLRVPAELSVVGFDDVPLSQWVSPPLTTVRQPIAEIAGLATRTLLAHLDGQGELPQGRIELSTTLIVRNSTAAPPR
jgi:DNA-binding LacI/PurR family transcriptional regulator